MNPICREPSLYAPILTPFEVTVFVVAHHCYALTILPICFCRGRAEFIPTRSGARLRVVVGLRPVLLLAECWTGPKRLRTAPKPQIRWSRGPDCAVGWWSPRAAPFFHRGYRQQPQRTPRPQSTPKTAAPASTPAPV